MSPSRGRRGRSSSPVPTGGRPADAVLKITIDRRTVEVAVIAFGLLLVTALGYRIGVGGLALPELAVPTTLDDGASLWLVLLTGLSVGGLSCLAVQGGLLATLIASRTVADDHREVTLADQVLPVTQFLLAKIAAYTLLGALLGLVGSKIPLGLQAWLMIFAGVFMLIVVAQMYDAHPFFRRFAFKPPKALRRLIRARSKQGGMAGALILGAMTVFIPCGVTLAIEALAISSESALRGAQIMFVFTLGSSPLFFLLGFVATHMSGRAFRIFQPVAAAVILLIATSTILSGARLLGFGGIAAKGPASQASMVSPNPEAAAAVQEATLQVQTGAYLPQRIQVRAGVPTRLSLVTDRTEGCVLAFVIPSLGIERILPATGTEVVEIPASEPGNIPFMCSMGMYTGIIEVLQ